MNSAGRTKLEHEVASEVCLTELQEGIAIYFLHRSKEKPRAVFTQASYH